MTPAVEALSPNHRIAREFQKLGESIVRSSVCEEGGLNGTRSLLSWTGEQLGLTSSLSRKVLHTQHREISLTSIALQQLE